MFMLYSHYDSTREVARYLLGYLLRPCYTTCKPSSVPWPQHRTLLRLEICLKIYSVLVTTLY